MTSPAEGAPTSVPSPLDRPPPAGEARQPEDFPDVGLGSLASFGQRAGGMVVDLLPFYVALNLVVLRMAPSGTLAEIPSWVSPAFDLGFVVVQVALLAIFGRTLGCFVAGIRVARYYDGGRPQFHQAMIRCLIPAGAGAMFDPVGLGDLGLITELAIYFSALADPLLRGLHDKAAGTIVVRTK